jgi:hypothetical protein
MKTKEAVHEDEERIRKLVRELPDDRKLIFFKEAAKSLKDPDTYAALNFLFVAGLHHFYLGKWIRGFINFFIFLLGVITLLTGQVGMGIFLLLAITVIELKALFNSQILIQAYNNDVMETTYHAVVKDQ